MFLGFVVGSIIGIAMALRKGKMKGVKMPFGPSLIIGAWIAVMWGGIIWSRYRNAMGY